MSPKDREKRPRPGTPSTGSLPGTVNYPMLSIAGLPGSREGPSTLHVSDPCYDPYIPSRQSDNPPSEVPSPSLQAVSVSLRPVPSPTLSARFHSPLAQPSPLQYPSLDTPDLSSEYRTYLLHDCVCLVTNAHRGIGRAVALELASRGARIAVCYPSSEASPDGILNEIKNLNLIDSGLSAVLIKADASRFEDARRMFEEARAAFGKIDIVVSNEGQEHWSHISEVTEEDVDKIFGLNFRSQLFIAKQAYHHLSYGGRLILMSSVFAQAQTTASHCLYNSSKAAVEALVRSLPADFREKEVTVNGVAPGVIKGEIDFQVARYSLPGTQTLSHEEIEAGHSKQSPLNRMGVPGDVARAVAFLATGDGAWMNGQILLVAGGAPCY